MALTRDNAALYLNAEFDSLATAIGQTTFDDEATGYGPDIDNALRALGKTESELATTTIDDVSRDDYFALLEFYFTRRAWRQLSDRADWTAGPDSARFGAQLRNAKDLYDVAKKKAEDLGYDVEGAGWSVSYWNADYVEH